MHKMKFLSSVRHITWGIYNVDITFKVQNVVGIVHLFPFIYCRFNILLNSVIITFYFRLLSCLAHWSSIFAEVKFLPLFVFPFVKVFKNDPFVCFEVVTTIISKYFQCV